MTLRLSTVMIILELSISCLKVKVVNEAIFLARYMRDSFTNIREAIAILRLKDVECSI